MANPNFRIEGVHAGYVADVDILRGLDLETAGRPVTLIVGPNGAGKSTVLKAAYGFLRPRIGKILLDGVELNNLPPFELKRRGLGFIPQTTNVFPNLSVIQNLRLGGFTLRRQKRLLRERIDKVFDVFPFLAERRYARASELSGGQAKSLSIAKEMVTEPRILLVDEPTAGLSPVMSDLVYDVLLKARESFDAQVLLVDQNIEDSVAIADYVYMLDLGRVRAEGAAKEFTDSRVRTLIQEALNG